MATPHTPTCAVTLDRMNLTQGMKDTIAGRRDALADSDNDLDGSEQGMLLTFSILRGIVTEYQDGGDQEQELCNCGAVKPPMTEVQRNVIDELMGELENLQYGPDHHHAVTQDYVFTGEGPDGPVTGWVDKHGSVGFYIGEV